jgi:hypothetical protein
VHLLAAEPLLRIDEVWIGHAAEMDKEGARGEVNLSDSVLYTSASVYVVIRLLQASKMQCQLERQLIWNPGSAAVCSPIKREADI